MHRIESGHFKHEGFTLAYELHGPDQGLPVLLMHGILLDSAINRDLTGPLVEAGCRVILLDLLGHGRSDKAAPTDLRNEYFAEQVVACLDHLGIDKAVVGGLSLGAIVALHVATATPQRTRGLLLEMPVMERSTVFAAILLAPLVLATHYFSWIHRPIAALIRKLPRPRSGIWESVLNTAGQEPEAIKAVLHGILVGPVVPTRRARRGIKVPALIIGHDGDWLHNVRDSKALAEEIPNARLIFAHSFLELRTKPERLMPEIVQFLREVSGEKVVRLPLAPATPESAADSELRQRFDAAVEKVRDAPEVGTFKPSNEMKLKMYALYRQAQDGDVQGKRPGMMDVVARFKYDAWAALQGVSRDEAMQRYLAEIETLEKKYA